MKIYGNEVESITLENAKTDYFDSRDFGKEKDLCDYLELNIDVFCNQFNIDKLQVVREKYFERRNSLSGNKQKIDFYIKEKDGKCVLIEVKNPRNNVAENRNAISQMLEYITLAEKTGEEVKRAIILTTQVTENMIDVIERFKLPLEVIFFSKEYSGLYKGGGYNEQEKDGKA